jgi:hypothetical protein
MTNRQVQVGILFRVRCNSVTDLGSHCDFFCRIWVFIVLDSNY